jgi:hypothetical protein
VNKCRHRRRRRRRHSNLLTSQSAIDVFKSDLITQKREEEFEKKIFAKKS